MSSKFTGGMLQRDISGVRNLLVNGGFELWPDATSYPGVASGDELNNGWTVGKTVGATVDVSRTTSEKHGEYAARVNVSVAGGGSDYVYLFQYFGGGSTVTPNVGNRDTIEALIGKKITFSAWVKAAAASKAQVIISVYDGTGAAISSVSSSYNVGTGYEQLTVTHTVPALAANIQFDILVKTDATGVCDIDSAMVAVGEFVTLDYEAMDPQYDEANIGLYFEKGTDWYEARTGGGFGGTTSDDYVTVPFKYRKRVTPTITLTDVSSPNGSISELGGGYTDRDKWVIFIDGSANGFDNSAQFHWQAEV